MTIDSADDSKISNRTITTNRISYRTYDSKSNRITKLRRSLVQILIFSSKCGLKRSAEGKGRKIQCAVLKIPFKSSVIHRLWLSRTVQRCLDRSSSSFCHAPLKARMPQSRLTARAYRYVRSGQRVRPICCADWMAVLYCGCHRR